MEDLAPIIQDIQDKWLSLTGIKSAPDTPIETEMVYPFVMTYERSGEMQFQSSGWSTPYTTIWSELHLNRALLPKAVETALAFRNLFLKKIRTDPTLSNTCQTITTARWTFGYLAWGGVENKDIGYRFEIIVKTHLVSA